MVLASPIAKKRFSDQSPEYELILACARCQPDIHHLNCVLDQTESNLNWEEVIQSASMHGVLPLVYRGLAECVPERVPKAILSRLMKLYLMNCAHNQRLSAATQDLVTLFAKQSIPLIVFKGPVLAETVYGSINFRRFSDIDLLVHGQDVSKVRQLLIDQGYRPRLLTEDRKTSEYLQSRIWDDSFTHSETQVTVDLHWQLMPDYFPVAFDLAQVWSNRQSMMLQAVKLYTLSPEDLLPYLCAHGSKELWRRLIWICDVAEFIRVHPHLPWLDLLARSRQLGIERMVLLAMSLAHELLDMPLPEPLIELVRQPVIQSLTQTFKGRICCTLDRTVESAEQGFWLFHNPLHLKMRDRWRDRLPQYWLTLKFLVTPNREDQEFLKLPPLLHSLYYLVRPLRILLKWGFSRKNFRSRLSA